MLRFLFLLLILFGVALGLHWLRDLSGEVAMTIGDTAYALDLPVALIALIGGVLLVMGLFWFIRELIRSPWRFLRGWRRRNEDRGRQAISQGLIAVAAGDLRAAERAATEAARRTPELPLTRLLQAQAAQLKGDRDAARAVFRAMTEHAETRIAGLRGLHIEAEREGEHQAARLTAERAREEAPSAPWAARALLRHQTAEADWDGALKTLSGASDGRILDKRTARRLRAVLLAAKARDSELGDPDAARGAALEAHELAPDLVPAAVAAGRLLARQGDVRRATRVLEETWKAGPHPEVAEAYLHVRTGDAASDRLKRAETLFRMRPQADEGRHAVARAAIDARDFTRARDVLRPILTERPTRKALILMSELEQAENGDSGRARGWLARAVHAPRDPAWTADGMVLEEWAPASPVSGRLDTVEWKIPLTELEAPQIAIDATELLPAPPPASLEEQPVEPADEAAESPEALTENEASRTIHAAQSPPPASTAEPPTGAPPPQFSGGPSSSAASPGTPPRGPRRSPVSGGSREPPATMPSAPRQIEPEAPMPPPIPDDPGVGDDEDETVRRLRVL